MRRGWNGTCKAIRERSRVRVAVRSTIGQYLADMKRDPARRTVADCCAALARRPIYMRRRRPLRLPWVWQSGRGRVPMRRLGIGKPTIHGYTQFVGGPWDGLKLLARPGIKRYVCALHDMRRALYRRQGKRLLFMRTEGPYRKPTYMPGEEAWQT